MINKAAFFLIFLTFFLPSGISASFNENNLLEDQLELIDFSEFDQAVHHLRKDNQYLNDHSLKSLTAAIIKGEFGFSIIEISKAFFQLLFKEVVAQIYLMRKLFIICLFSAMVKILSSSFESKAVAELGFFTAYIVLIIVLFESFNLAGSIVRQTIAALYDIMFAFMPVITAFYATTGQLATAMVMNPLVLSGIHFLTMILKNIILPLITFAAMLQIINHLNQENYLDRLSVFLKLCISWLLKGIAILLISVLSLESLGAPVFNKALNKSAKFFVGAAPVVGDVLTGAVDTVMSFAAVVQSGATAGIIIFIILASIIPAIKLFAMMLSFKLTAAFIEPVSEDRIVDCIDAIGTFTGFLLGALMLVIIMMIVFILILMSTAKF